MMVSILNTISSMQTITWENCRFRPLQVITHFEITINFFLTSVQVILVPYCCLVCVLSSDYGECLYRHIFLEDTCTNI